MEKSIMEGLDMSNILSPDEVDNLFTDDGGEETQVIPPEKQEEYLLNCMKIQ